MTDLELELLLTSRAPDLGALWGETLPVDPPLPFTPSPRFRRRMDGLLRRMGDPSIWKQMGRTVAAAVLVAVFTGAGLFATSEAFRSYCISIFQEITQSYALFQFFSDREEPEAVGELTYYLPDGFVETYSRLSTEEYAVHYENESGESLRIRQVAIHDGMAFTYSVDTENAEVTYFDLHGAEAMAVSKGLGNTIVWTTDAYFYSLGGTISMDELEKVAFSLR